MLFLNRILTYIRISHLVYVDLRDIDKTVRFYWSRVLRSLINEHC